MVAGDVHAAGPEDVDRAVKAAADAFKVWRKFSGAQRAACMIKFADLIEQNGEKLAKAETVAMGQPIGIAKHIASWVPPVWRYYAGYCDKIGGETFPEDGDGSYKIVQYEPYGVCAGLAAWNTTLLFTAWKMAP